MAQVVQKHLRHEAYSVAIICPLEVELSAARYMLDEEHKRLPARGRDTNQYYLGEMNGHNVVIASLPLGSQGIGAAATVATQLTNTFPHITLRLLVGIGGGIPLENDIRLGDVVVSIPTSTFGGVIQYDLGKATPTWFQLKGCLRPPPQQWLSVLNRVKSNHRTSESKINTHVDDMLRKYPTLANDYSRPSQERDLLFSHDYEHVLHEQTCAKCDKAKTIERSERKASGPFIHYGLIASGNSVIKDALQRNEISRHAGGALCFEMEAAGLMNDFECLVIRGISDYADSHKNDVWHAYAAAAAAAFAKELLSELEVTAVSSVSKQGDSSPLLGRVSEHAMDQLVVYTHSDSQEKVPSISSILDSISPYDHELQFRRVRDKRLEGTAEWVWHNSKFEPWRKNPRASLAFICKGIVGSGKTFIANLVVEKLKTDAIWHTQTVIYFSFDPAELPYLSTDAMIRSFIKQLVIYLQSARVVISSVIQQIVWKSFSKDKKLPDLELFDIWLQLLKLAKRVFIIIDGLHELDDNNIIRCLKFLKDTQDKNNLNYTLTKFAIFTREQSGLHVNLENYFTQPVVLHLEIELLKDDISAFINISIERKNKLQRQITRDEKLLRDIKDKLRSKGEKMFLWISLQITSLWEHCYTDFQIKEALDRLPDDLNETYGRCLQKILGNPVAVKYSQRAFGWLAFARRPLTPSELSEAVSIEDMEGDFDESSKPNATVPSYCANLIEHDRVSDQIHFIHPSVKEFLQGNKTDPKFRIEDSLEFNLCGQCCLKYLTFRTFQLPLQKLQQKTVHIQMDIPAQSMLDNIYSMVSLPLSRLWKKRTNNSSKASAFDPRSMRGRVTKQSAPDLDVTLKYQFLDYARRYWPLHLRDFDAEVGGSSSSFAQTWSQIRELALTPNLSYRLQPWAQVTSTYENYLSGLLAYAIENELLSLLQCVNESSEAFRIKLETRLCDSTLFPVHLAVVTGNEAILSWLVRNIRMKACEIGDHHGNTAMHLAIIYRRTNCANLLSAKCPGIVFLPNQDNVTPLMLAARYGLIELIQDYVLQDVRLDFRSRLKRPTFKRESHVIAAIEEAMKYDTNDCLPDTHCEIIGLLVDQLYDSGVSEQTISNLRTMALEYGDSAAVDYLDRISGAHDRDFWGDDAIWR